MIELLWMYFACSLITSLEYFLWHIAGVHPHGHRLKEGKQEYDDDRILARTVLCGMFWPLFWAYHFLKIAFKGLSMFVRGIKKEISCLFQGFERKKERT